MKITCSKIEMFQAIQIAAKAISNKQQTPILSGIYLKAENEKLEIQATNYEIGFICHINANVSETGSAVLSGKYLQEVSRKLPGEKVSLTLNSQSNVMTIESNYAKFTLRSMPSEEFPTISKFSYDTSFNIQSNTLAELIRKTSYACSNDETKPLFTGCFMSVKDNLVTMAATNTHRLAVKQSTINDFQGSIKIIIPSKVLNETLHFLNPDKLENVNVTYSQKQIGIEYKNIYMVSRIIEGQYPDYERVIPASFSTHAQMSKEDLSAAVDRVSLISRADEYNIISFDFTNDTLKISSQNNDIGNAEEIVPIKLDGPEIKISFNANYIIDVLKVIESEMITLALNKSLNPIAIREENDETFIYIVTPVRTAN